MMAGMVVFYHRLKISGVIKQSVTWQMFLKSRIWESKAYRTKEQEEYIKKYILENGS